MSISIAAEGAAEKFCGFDGRGCLVSASFFGSYLINGVGKPILPAIKKRVTLRQCGCACLATQAGQRLSNEGQFHSTRDHGEGKMSALRNSGGRMLAVQAESRPSCPRFGQPGAAVPTHPWTGETPVPTRTVMAVTVFCEIRIPIPGLVNAAMTMETWSGRERLLQ
jgi:hypothetical protein